MPTRRAAKCIGCGSELSSIDGEIRDINVRLEDKDKEQPLGKKERDALMFRLGVLTVRARRRAARLRRRALSRPRPLTSRLARRARRPD